jgi:hypothetical protein
VSRREDAEGVKSRVEVCSENTFRTRHASPTATDRHLLNCARYFLQTNQTGACVVFFPSFLTGVENKPPLGFNAVISPPITQPNPQRHQLSKRDANIFLCKKLNQSEVFPIQAVLDAVLF